ncbi:MAG: DUF7901 domain-containing protein [Planctomycetota bacterium]
MSVALLTPLVIGSGDAPPPAPPQLTGGAQATQLSGGPAGGGGTAADLGVVCNLVVNCQLPDQDGHGSGNITGTVSDAAFATGTGIAAAERIGGGAARTLNEICWWGGYWDVNAGDPDCDDQVTADAFTVTIYTNNSDWVPGCPVSVPGTVYATPSLVALQKAATGFQFSGLDEYEYTAGLNPPVALAADTCYWIEIQNDTTGTTSDTCYWLWQTAPPGDSVSAQHLDDTTAYTQADVNDFDLALCLNVSFGNTAVCDPTPIQECVGQLGYCGAPHANPGCSDPCCCTVVCEILPICCTADWDQTCADIAVSEGCALPLGLVCDVVAEDVNCQLPDREGHGADGIVGATSDGSAGGGPGYAVAERVSNEGGTLRSLNQVCWWGFYLDFDSGTDCSDDPAILNETFDVTIYYDDNSYLTGCPTSIPGAVYKSFPDIVFQKAQTGNLVAGSSGDYFEHEYSAILSPAVTLRPNTCYWIEVKADTTGTVSDSCLWLFQTAAPGDNVSAQDASADGVYVQGSVSDYDMAMCLDISMGDTSICDPPIEPLCEPDPPVDVPCALPHAGVGCADPCCCTVVCGILPTCCTVEWDFDCASLAISEGCALLGYPVCMATGPDNNADGYLKICSDPYGAWADDASYSPDGADDPDWGDEFRPESSTLSFPTFTATHYIFKGGDPGPPHVDGTHREMLTTNIDLLDYTGAYADNTLVAQFAGVTSLGFDTNGDGVDDKLTSEYTVTGANFDISVILTQQVETGDGVNMPFGVSAVTQTMDITNNLSGELTFELLRHIDADLLWVNGATDDSVGTNTNGSPLDRHVFQHEVASPTQAMTLSSPNGGVYYGAINTHDPDGVGDCPAMGYGTDTQQWDAWGIPCAWYNYIAFVGYDTNGETGNQANDASIGLEIPVTIPGNSTETIVVITTYGSTVPAGAAGEPCPCDCEDPPDGTVDVGDFLAMLAQWGTPGSCDCEDPPDGAVDVGDFLAILAAWGPCP